MLDYMSGESESDLIWNYMYIYISFFLWFGILLMFYGVTIVFLDKFYMEPRQRQKDLLEFILEHLRI